jgi:hypothetical protein
MGDDFMSKIHPFGMMNLRPHNQNPLCGLKFRLVCEIKAVWSKPSKPLNMYGEV